MNAATLAFGEDLQRVETRRKADADCAEILAQNERHHFDQRLDTIQASLTSLPTRLAAPLPAAPRADADPTRRSFLDIVDRSRPLQWGFAILLMGLGVAMLAASLGGDHARQFVAGQLPLPAASAPRDPDAPEPTH